MTPSWHPSIAGQHTEFYSARQSRKEMLALLREDCIDRQISQQISLNSRGNLYSLLFVSFVTFSRASYLPRKTLPRDLSTTKNTKSTNKENYICWPWIKTDVLLAAAVSNCTSTFVLKHKQHSSFRGFRAFRGSSRASYLPRKAQKARTKKLTYVDRRSKLTYYSKQPFAITPRPFFSSTNNILLFVVFVPFVVPLANLIYHEKHKKHEQRIHLC